MAKVITDKKAIDEVLSRGVEQIFPDTEQFRNKLISGERIRLYCGFDPSAASLHIGNAIQINKLAQFQRLGHEVIFLVGDFTGMIGDPTDKGATRKKLTREEVLKNAESYKEQASKYLDFDGENPAKIMYNSQWSDKLTFKDLIELSSNFTVQQMIQRDMFQKRLEEGKPIHLHEFLYPLAQGFDSSAMDVDLEIGGNDQMFNMLCGRDLMKALGQKEKFVMTTKILADDQGKKMGKSEGNVVFLNENNINMYGKIMAWPDGVIANALELCTNVSVEEIENIREVLKSEESNPRDFKMRLAFEITAIVHGKDKAIEAQEYFIKTFQKRELPDEIEELVVTSGSRLLEVIVEAGLAESKGDAKRKMEQGGVKIGDETASEIGREISVADNGKVVKVGKRFFRKLMVE